MIGIQKFMHMCRDAYVHGCGCLGACEHGCEEAWALVCVDVRMLGGLCAWVCGCLEVWVHGCSGVGGGGINANRKQNLKVIACFNQ